MKPAFLAALARLSPDDPAWAGVSATEAAWLAWVTTLAHDPQRPPAGDWRTWVFLGGRGAGKTRAGAEWLSFAAARLGRVALVGPTLHDVREVMVGGPSGLARLPGRPAPRFEPSRRRIAWENGAEGFAFSAEDPDSLRGPQFAAAWADEFCAWAHPGETLANLRLGLRLGSDPRLMVSTTPRPMTALRRLLAEPGTARSDGATAINADHLSAGFVEHLTRLYGGTRLAAQELEGALTEGEGALFTAEMFARARAGVEPPPPSCGRSPSPGGGGSGFERVVVAVDPPAGREGAACGIVAAGRREGLAWVLADASVRGLSPQGWAERVAATARAWGAQVVVAEANQGGEMVKSVLKAAGVEAPVRLVHARAGKRVRAEPVAALYEQGRVRHAGAFRELEEQLMALGGDGAVDDDGMRDRADPLVWAVTDLLVEARAGPRVRVL